MVPPVCRCSLLAGVHGLQEGEDCIPARVAPVAVSGSGWGHLASPTRTTRTVVYALTPAHAPATVHVVFLVASFHVQVVVQSAAVCPRAASPDGHYHRPPHIIETARHRPTDTTPEPPRPYGNNVAVYLSAGRLLVSYGFGLSLRSA